MKQRGVGVGGNLRFESRVLQSELLQTVGLADRVENLVHHLGTLQTKHQLVTSPGEQSDTGHTGYSRTNIKDCHHHIYTDSVISDCCPLRVACKLQ